MAFALDFGDHQVADTARVISALDPNVPNHDQQIPVVVPHDGGIQLTFRDVGRTEEQQKEWDRHTVRANQEVMIYGFVVRIVAELNLLDFFERFKHYVEETGMAVYDSFAFTKWLMQDERLAVQDQGVAVDLDNLQKFWGFQDKWLEEQRA